MPGLWFCAISEEDGGGLSQESKLAEKPFLHILQSLSRCAMVAVDNCLHRCCKHTAEVYHAFCYLTGSQVGANCV